MPLRNDLQSVLVIGSGPIVIGQACEFDYSGTQACRVLRAEGLRVILINSNPATIMTDPDVADATYVEPIDPDIIESIIAKERPDAILPTLGGQTALNAAIALHEAGTLEKYGVELIGADVDAIQRGEDRQKFKQIVEDCGAEVARSVICHTLDEAIAGAEELGYPLVVRPSFTMGGLGSGMAYDETDLRRIAGAGLSDSLTTEVLLEESILGWKEYELELMRDHKDNVVVVCSIENVDPVGVHTGDSITVAPSLTLTDREYQTMRDIGIDVIRAVGVDTGGCNIQFAVDPATGRIVVIEMNPRVSRSSALASKATGFPIAKMAAKLAVGYSLDEIPNDITKVTPASFEPTLDYVVVKIPRFTFEKFPAADPTLTTTMKSVGEVMALGRNFTTALQKAMRSMEQKAPRSRGPTCPTSPTTKCARPCSRRSATPPPTASTPSSADSPRACRTPRCTRPAASTRGSSTRSSSSTRSPPSSPTRGARRRGHPGREEPRLLRRADRRSAQPEHRRRHRRPSRPAHPARVQDRRHVRRRVRGPHAVPLLELRLRDRSRTPAAPGGAHPRFGSEPDRSGHRIRLLVRACDDGNRRGRLRDRHGQLQPGDRLDGLRHRRPPLLRTAHLRRRHGGLPR